MRLKYLTAAAVSALLLAGGAHAADMPVYYEQPAPEPEFGGWYLRGDVGISHQRTDGFYNAQWDLDPSITSVSILADDFDASWFLGLGVGYQFSKNFRADITGEYRGKSDFYGVDVINDGGLINEYRTDKSEWTFLANVYWDMFTWNSITPFIGAGIGASYNRIGDVTDTNLNDPSGGPFCPVSNGCAGANGDWDLAWALHAGLAFDVSQNMKVEVAYRYLNLGGAKSENIIGSGGLDAVDNPLEFDELTSHDVKIALRYLLH